MIDFSYEFAETFRLSGGQKAIQKKLLKLSQGETAEFLAKNGDTVSFTVLEEIGNDCPPAFFEQHDWDLLRVRKIFDVSGIGTCAVAYLCDEAGDEDKDEIYFAEVSSYEKNISNGKTTYTVHPLPVYTKGYTLPSVPVDSPVSRVGGIPVDSAGNPITQWPHVKVDGNLEPLFFEAQYLLPTGKMAWVFIGTMYIEEIPYKEYFPEFTVRTVNGNEEFVDINLGQEAWDKAHNLNAGEFIFESDINFDFKDIFVIIEGEDIPRGVKMIDNPPVIQSYMDKTPIANAYALIHKDLNRIPSWVQGVEVPKKASKFLFQMKYGRSSDDLNYNEYNSDLEAFVFWDGEHKGAVTTQC